jgi:hypothetical protein
MGIGCLTGRRGSRRRLQGVSRGAASACSCIEETRRRRSLPDPAAIGATNLVAVKDTATFTAERQHLLVRHRERWGPNYRPWSAAALAGGRRRGLGGQIRGQRDHQRGGRVLVGREHRRQLLLCSQPHRLGSEMQATISCA